MTEFIVMLVKPIVDQVHGVYEWWQVVTKHTILWSPVNDVFKQVSEPNIFYMNTSHPVMEPPSVFFIDN